MKNERGAIKLVILIGIVYVLAVALFIAVVIMRTEERLGADETNNTNNNTTTIEQQNNTEISNTNNEINNNTTTENTKNTVKANEDFDVSFLKQENNKKNMIYSPLSIKYALKMLQEGADGNTLTQIQNVIGNTELPKYQNIQDTLSLANGIFIRDTYYPNVKNSYIDVLNNKYLADIAQDPFANANNVNKWIENKTLGIIKNMLQDKLVQNPDTVMLLINALGIDMEWESKFDTLYTGGQKFYLEDGKEMQATTMNKNKVRTKGTSYYKEKDITALSMNLKEYDGKQMEFVAIMPEKNLKEYVDNLTNEKINEITKNMKSADTTAGGLNISIPKFSFDYDLKLKDDLKNLGITDAFDKQQANLSKMADLEKTGKNIYVSEALHKANIDFTEKGVKAAAVTVFAVMQATAMIEKAEPITINIDKPFLFLIRDNNTKDIWFVGTVYEPNSWEKDKSSYETKNENLNF